MVDLLEKNGHTVEVYRCGNRIHLPYRGHRATYFIKHCIIVEWVDEQAYKVIDLGDPANTSYMFSKEFVRSPNCIQVFKAQYNNEFLKDVDKIRPFYYWPRYHHILEKHIGKLRQNKRKRRQMLFRGDFAHGRWNTVKKLYRSGALAQSPLYAKVNPKKYYYEMSSHKVVLSLPGGGQNCHREIEAFGIGTPVIMPEQRNEYATPLVPNVHYISVPNDRHRATRIMRRYYRVIDDDKFLTEVAINAMKWYDKYARLPHATRVMLQMLGFEIKNV